VTTIQFYLQDILTAFREFTLLIAAAACLFVFGTIVPAQTQFSVTPDNKTMLIDDAPEMEVVAFGKTVIVRGRAKGVLAVGGDVIVEGQVSEDVATIGGSIVQKSDGYIGGDVIAFGGVYKPESLQPLREQGKETVMFGMFEDELRDIAQNPTELLSPSLSLSFLAQRILSVLFWFIVSLGLTTLAPGAVSRAVARFQLSVTRVILIGIATLFVILVAVAAVANVLPDYLSVSFGLMAFVLVVLAYVFGRVALQVSIGKMIQKHMLGEQNRSETLAILLGVVFWTVLLSLPYVWTLALLALFAAGSGLVLTARSNPSWSRS
jgi:hypothetical protein